MSDERNRDPVITFRIPEDDLAALNSFVTDRATEGRSEVIREAIRSLIDSEADVETTEMTNVA